MIRIRNSKNKLVCMADLQKGFLKSKYKQYSSVTPLAVGTSHYIELDGVVTCITRDTDHSIAVFHDRKMPV